MQKSNHRRLKTKHSNKNIAKPVFLFAAILVLSVMSLVAYKVFTVDGFAFVNKAGNGDAEIIVFDPVANTTKSFIVEGDTVLSSSRSLGEYRLDNLWILSRKEGHGGKLIAESISKNFLVPISYWKDGSNTNLDLYKLIRAKIILRSGSIEKKVIKLDNLTNSILVNFVNTEMSDKGVNVEIEDLTGTVSISNDVAKILEILGTKITSFSKGYEKDLDCEVLGTSKKLVEVIATYLGCKETVKQDLKTDIVVRLGGQFAERF